MDNAPLNLVEPQAVMSTTLGKSTGNSGLPSLGWGRSFWHTLCVALMATAMSGCQQLVLLSYLIGGPPSIEPEFDAETGKSMNKPKTRVLVVCYAPPELQWNYPQINDEVAAALTYRLAEHHIQVVAPDFIRAWIDEHKDYEKAEEIGRAFNVDYVIEVELASFNLYEDGNRTVLYRGRTEAYVHVTEIEKESGSERIYTKEVNFAFPIRIPRSAYDQSLLSFKREYLSRLSEKIGWLFYESYQGDQIGWAT